jgi:hypothetical protein
MRLRDLYYYIALLVITILETTFVIAILYFVIKNLFLGGM